MAGTKRIIRHFPHFFQTEDYLNLFHQFIGIFGSVLDDADEDLLRVMRSHWVDKADNEGSKGFDTIQKGDLDKIFSLYLENLGGTSLLRQINRRDGEAGLEDDAIYRKRIKAIIQVLMNGASNREGIISIIAANLGITGDSPEALIARDQIEMIEYLPDYQPTTLTGLTHYQTFLLNNPGPEPIPTDIKIKVGALGGFPVNKLTLINLDTQFSVEFDPDNAIEDNDELLIQSNGTATLNGTDNVTSDLAFTNGLPLIPPGVSQWQIRSLAGQYDYSDFAPELNYVFDNADNDYPYSIFAPDTPLYDVEMLFEKIHPATFMVLIPWDIPGFTEIFDELDDEPRSQIRYIVDKVKAAGVLAVISYEKKFVENHEMEDSFSTADDDRTYLLEQAMEDTLMFGGVFDYTGYDYSLFN